jgi:tRNA uridine 5-carbamoylmethylation protein Kti12
MAATPVDIPTILHDQPSLTVCVGLPGCGKTWWSGEQLHRAVAAGRRGRLWRTNRDDYRRMMLDSLYGRPPLAEIEDVITTLQYQQMHMLLAGGVHVICDDTNLNPLYLERLLKVATNAGAVPRARDFTAVPLETCIQRDSWRDYGAGYVGEAVIREMYERFIAPYVNDLEHPCVAMIRAAGELPVRGNA